MHFILRVGCVRMGTLTRVELNNMSCGAVWGGGARNDCSSPHGCRRLRGIDKTRMDIKKAEVIIKKFDSHLSICLKVHSQQYPN